ncbi:MAG TPA: hypothetical protein VFA59_17185 [Vicinamibacterales bacterium]|nr:hypothetical protein [Vicinamibacterales bacterium]
MDRSAALGHYDALIRTIPAVERRGDTVPYADVAALKPKAAAKKAASKKKR